MTDRTFHIAVLPGDGIGPEVSDQATRLLKEMETQLSGVRFDLQEYSVGVSQYLRSGTALPDSAFEACEKSDAVLLGAMGLPDVRYADGTEIAPQLDLRERLGLYGGIRPIRLFHPSDTPLKDFGEGDIDLVIVRESTEGLFYGRSAVAQLDADEACNTLRITRSGAQRVCRLAFEVARRRDRGKRVTLVDKANVLSSMVFFRSVFDTVATEFPDCAADHVYVDAAALFLTRDPTRFDVMVTENMFGDILSDLAAGLVGGMGMAPSGDLGDRTAVFQPSHGSAPDIAGKGIANPVAMILSTAMMLDWLGHDETQRGGRALQNAVAAVLRDPTNRTPDMKGTLSTTQITAQVSRALEQELVATGQ